MLKIGRTQPRSSSFLTILCLLVSGHFTVAYLTLTRAMVPFHGYNNLVPRGSPFDYRMLPAILWKLTRWALRPALLRWPGLHMPFLNEPFNSDENWFVALLTFSSLFAALSVARRLVRAVDSTPAFEWLALSFALFAYFDIVLVLNRNLYYPYDLPALFFFMLLVYLAYTGRSLLFIPVLALAVLNKETAAMSVLVFFGLQYGRKPLPRLLATCAGYTILVASIRVAQRLWIQHQCAACGAMSEVHTLYNLRQAANPLFWFSIASIFGYSWVAIVPLWRNIPLQVRYTAAATGLLWTAAMLRVGVIREIRIFSELSALCLLMLALGLRNWIEQFKKPAASSALPPPP